MKRLLCSLAICVLVTPHVLAESQKLGKSEIKYD